MRLDDLLRGLVRSLDAGPRAIDVGGVALDSRRVAPGDVFFALAGAASDGSQHIGEAVARGAVVVVAPEPVRHDVGVPVVVSADARRIVGLADVAVGAAVAGRFG